MLDILILMGASLLFTLAAFGIFLAPFPFLRTRPVISRAAFLVVYLIAFVTALAFCG